MNNKKKQRKALSTEHRRELVTQLMVLSQRPESIVLMIMERTGARIHEVMHMTAESFSEGSGVLFIRGAKGSADRVIPLINADLWAQAKLLLGDSNFLYESIADGFAGAKKRVYRFWAEIHKKKPLNEFPRATPHGLRHSWVLDALDMSGGNVVQAQHAIGHKSLNSTAQYLKDIEIGELLKKMANR